ncbi:MAG TPA: FAD-dependent oxidoreductase [Acidimicrobiia bacterium]|nr:FAD-dependent oxidoreductase [Acidimicrobiia bacterium]
MSHDVVIVGGGAMGSSTAYHLMKEDPSLSVVVIEKDNTYTHASTVLSDGNVRIQFNLEENIRISQHTMNVLRTFGEDMATARFRPDIGARHQGNLFLSDEAHRESALDGLALQRSLACDVEWLDAPEIEERFPGLELAEIVGGTLGSSDGSVDPGAVLRGYRGKAIELGARYIEDEVVTVSKEHGRVTGVRLRSGSDLAAPTVFVAAGAWSADLVRPLGVDLPVVPVMRTVYVVSTTMDTAGMPSVFLPSGVYALPESDRTWVMAWSRPDDPVGFDFTPAGRHRFTDVIWPELHRNVPAFDSLEVQTSWAGLYDVNTLDGNAIIGEWPTIVGLLLATGFSGHGFQQCPAVGRYLAERILGQTPTLDLSRLGGERILEDQPLYEHEGRLI